MSIHNSTSIPFGVSLGSAAAGEVRPSRAYFNQVMAGLKVQPLRMTGAKPLTSDLRQVNENSFRDCGGSLPHA